MDSTIVGYIFLGLVGLIALASFLWGIKRGLKKTLFRLLWLVLTAVLVWFTTPVLSNWLNNFDISSLKLNIFGPVSRISDVGVNVVKHLGFEELLNSQPAMQTFVQNLPTMVLNVILFVVLFWALKIVLWPIWALIASKLFDKKKREAKQYHKKIKGLKKKGMPVTDEGTPLNLVEGSKHRFLGGLVGLAVSILLVAVTFSPIIGVNAVFQKVQAEVQIEKDGEKVPLLSTLVDDKILGYANSYENSIASKVVEYSGAGILGSFVFGNMASVQVGSSKIKLITELDTGIAVYKKGIKLYGYVEDLASLKASQIDEILVLVNDSLDILNKSTALYSLGDELLHMATDKYIVSQVNEEDFKFEVAEMDFTDSVKAIVNKISNEKIGVMSLKEQVAAATNVVSLLNSIKPANNPNDESLLSNILGNKIGDINSVASYLAENVVNSTGFSNEFVNNVLDVSIIQSELPKVLNNLVEEIYSALDMSGFEEKANLTIASVAQSLKNVFKNALDFIKFYEASDELDFGQNTQSALSALGDIIDELKDNFLSMASYLPEDASNTTDGLVNFLISKINDLAGDAIDVSKVTSSLRDVTSWKTELTALAPIYDVVINIKNDNEHPFDENSFLDENYTNIYDFGPAIGTVISNGKSKLVTNKNMREIFESLLNSSAVTSSDLNEYLMIDVQTNASTPAVSLKTLVLNNIYDPSLPEASRSKIVSWQNEIEYTINFIRKANKSLAGFDRDLTTVEEMRALGKAIDDGIANTKMILSNSVMRALMNKFIYSFDNEKLSEIFDMTYDVNVGSVKDAMLNNICNLTNGQSKVTNWEDELALLQSLLSTDLSSTSSVSAVGELLDSIAPSKILSRDIVKKVVNHYIDEEFDKIADADLKASFQSAVEAIKENVETDAKDAQGNPKVFYGDRTIEEGSDHVVVKGEFSRLLDLIDVVERANKTYAEGGFETETEKFEAIGAEFNKLVGLTPNVAGSEILTKNVVNQMLSVYINKYVDENFGEGKAIEDEDVATILKKMSNPTLMENIVSYDTELVRLVELADVAGSPTLSTIGAKLDEYPKSVLVSAIVTELLEHYFDEQIDAISNEGLKTAARSLKANLSLVESYETELGYLDNIVDACTQATVDKQAVGQIFDTAIEAESKLVSTSAIESMINHFFEESDLETKKTTDYVDYADVIDEIKAKSASYFDGKSYETMFDELDAMQTKFEILSGLTYDINSFLADTTIGTTLDEFAAMEHACDRFVAKDIAEIVFGKIAEVHEQIGTEMLYASTYVNQVKVLENFLFATYCEKTAPANVQIVPYRATYYAEFVAELQSRIEAKKSELENPS